MSNYVASVADLVDTCCGGQLVGEGLFLCIGPSPLIAASTIARMVLVGEGVDPEMRPSPKQGLRPPGKGSAGPGEGGEDSKRSDAGGPGVSPPVMEYYFKSGNS